MRIADSDTRRILIDSTELVSYCERYGMEVIFEGVKVNQQNPNADFSRETYNYTIPSNSTFTIESGVLKVSYNSNESVASKLVRKAGHKYLLSIDAKKDEPIAAFALNVYSGSDWSPDTQFKKDIDIVGAWKRYSVIFNQTSDVDLNLYTRILQVANPSGGTVYGKNFIQRDLTELGLADKSLEWLQSNRPDLFQNLDYIPETKTIKSVIRRIK